MNELERIIDNTDIIIISDEVYEHIIFDGYAHESIAKHPSLSQRSFVIYSFGKTFHATGWKTGYCLAPAELMKEFRKVHQFNVFSVNTPIQHALAIYMKNKRNYEGLEQFYQQKRDKFLELIKGSRFKPLACHGSYFQLLDYSELSDEADTEYAKRLTKESGIASIPVSVFYSAPHDDKLLRFCFAKNDETLERAAERLCSIQ
jgi:methionine aminotransferase